MSNAITVVPATAAGWADVQVVFGGRGSGAPVARPTRFRLGRKCTHGG